MGFTALDKNYLRSQLPWSYRKLIREKLSSSYSDSYIEKVIKGERANNDIIIVAIEIAKAKMEEDAMLNNELSTLNKRYNHEN